MDQMDPERVLMAEYLRDVADRIERGSTDRVLVHEEREATSHVNSGLRAFGYDRKTLLSSVLRTANCLVEAG